MELAFEPRDDLLSSDSVPLEKLFCLEESTQLGNYVQEVSRQRLHRSPSFPTELSGSFQVIWSQDLLAL